MFLKEEKQLVIPRHGGGGAAKRSNERPAAILCFPDGSSPLLGQQSNKRQRPAAIPDGSSPPFSQHPSIWCPRLLLGSPYAGIVKKGFVFIPTTWKTVKFLLFLQ